MLAAFGRWNIVLGSLLLLLIVRLWLVPLPSSFWVDEMATAFVVRHGAQHPSFAVAPQVPQSIYYFFPGLADRLFGLSEIAYRIPSAIFMATALYFIARVAARLIHPDACWFAVFACLSLRGINYQAADARPYALGTAVLAAAYFFLVRWLDSGRKWDAAGFVLAASLPLRVHLVLWPSYLPLALYAAVRLFRRETPVRWPAATGIFGVLGLALLPPIWNAVLLLGEAATHAFAELPKARDLWRALKPGLFLGSAAGAILYVWLTRRKRALAAKRAAMPASAIVLILSWWLCQPLGLFAFSYATGNSVFVPRYLSAALPGAALAATALVRRFLPAESWRPAALLMGVAVFVFMGEWRVAAPRHDFSNWRSAVQAIQRIEPPPDTPVLCPSPFVEARWPVWRPDYPLPGFLYAHLDVYRVPDKTYLLPFTSSSEAEQYAQDLLETTLHRKGRFLIYGGDKNTLFWRDWFSARHEMSGWSNRRLGPFGNIEVVLFERGKP